MMATTPTITAGRLLDEFPFLRIGSAPQPLLIIPGAEISNADPGWLMQQSMRAAFRRFARDYSVFIVHRKRGLARTASIADMAADYVRVLHDITPQGARAHVMG